MLFVQEVINVSLLIGINRSHHHYIAILGNLRRKKLLIDLVIQTLYGPLLIAQHFPLQRLAIIGKKSYYREFGSY